LRKKNIQCTFWFIKSNSRTYNSS